MKQRIRVARGSENNIKNNSEIPPLGQLIFDTTNRYLFIGNGSRALNTFYDTNKPSLGIRAWKADRLSNTNAIGNETTPVYFNANGVPQKLSKIRPNPTVPIYLASNGSLTECSSLSLDTSGTANNAINVQNVNFASSSPAIFNTSTPNVSYKVEKRETIWEGDAADSITYEKDINPGDEIEICWRIKPNYWFDEFAYVITRFKLKPTLKSNDLPMQPYTRIIPSISSGSTIIELSIFSHVAMPFINLETHTLGNGIGDTASALNVRIRNNQISSMEALFDEKYRLKIVGLYRII